MKTTIYLSILIILFNFSCKGTKDKINDHNEYKSVPLKSEITSVQPIIFHAN